MNRTASAFRVILNSHAKGGPVRPCAFAYEDKDMFIVYPSHIQDIRNRFTSMITPPEGYVPVTIEEFSSQTARCISEEEIENYLDRLEL